MMDCSVVRLLLVLHRRQPDQLDLGELKAVERHVETCPSCLTWNQRETRFDEALVAAMKDVPTPTGLERRIRDRMRAARAPRRLGWLAAAASVLLGIGFTGFWLWPRPAAIDLTEFVQFVSHQNGQTPEAVREHFANLGHTMTPPPQFEYGYLATYDLARFQGKQVPRLTFQNTREGRGTVTAHVYVLPAKHFFLPEDAAEMVTNLNHQFHIIRGDDDIYVVDCTGGDVGVLRRGVY